MLVAMVTAPLPLTELTVYTTALMTLCTDDGKTTCSLYLRSQLDIGTTTCHVGSDGYGTLTVN